MRQWIVLCAAALCLLSGCAPHAQEPEGLELVRVLGVDSGAELTLTAICGSQNGQEPVRGTASAPEFDAARKQLPWSGGREMALTNLSYIIIGEGVELKEILTAVLNDQEMSPSAAVWFAEDVGQLLSDCKDPVGRLQVLSDQGTAAPTVVEALAELEAAEVVQLPALSVEEGMLRLTEPILWRKTE